MPCLMQTEYLLLRDLTEDDICHLRALAADAEVMRYVMLWLDSEEQIREFFDHALKSAHGEPRNFWLLGMFGKDGGGFAGVAILDRDAHGGSSAEVGYLLMRPFWGRGYATAVAAELINYAFAVLGMHRVWAKCDERNVASARVLEKCGMQYEGTLREHLWLRDHWRSSRVYSLLAHERA